MYSDLQTIAAIALSLDFDGALHPVWLPEVVDCAEQEFEIAAAQRVRQVHGQPDALDHLLVVLVLVEAVVVQVAK